MNAIIVQNIYAKFVASDFILDVPLLELPLARISCIVGPNGSGKSVLCKAIARSVPGSRVRVLRADGASASVAMVWQDARSNLALDLSVEENVRINALSQSRGTADLASELLREFSPTSSQLVGHLSGGQRQLLAFACAAHPGADLLILDEFIAALDHAMRKRLLEQARRHARSGQAVVIVTHDSHVVQETADHLIALDNGAIALSRLRGTDPWDKGLIEAALEGHLPQH